MHKLPRHIIFKHGVRKATYLRVFTYLRTLGAAHGGYWLDRDEATCAFLNISRNTLSRSYTWLSEQGYLERAGYWPGSKRKRYKLARLKDHEDQALRRGNRVNFADWQLQSNDAFIGVFVTIDVHKAIRAARYSADSTLRTKEANACRRGSKGASTSARLPFAYFCNRYHLGNKRFKRVQRLCVENKEFMSSAPKVLLKGLSALDMPYLDRKTDDGFIYLGKDGNVYLKKITEYSTYSINTSNLSTPSH